MANVTKTVEIVFGARNDLGKTVDVLSRQFGTLRDVSSQVTGPLSAIGEGVLKADAALAALAAGGMAYALNKSIQFESAMVGLKKVTDGNAEAMEAGRRTAMDLSSTYGDSSVNILNSTTNFVQAGYNTQEAMMLTKAAMDLKIAGDIGAVESSELLIATLKGFDAPAADATRLIDVLNEVSNKYATDVRQLGVGMSTLAPIAKTMGFSFEQTAGLLTPVIEVFRSGNESAMALKTGLLKLIDDAKPVQEALASIGVSQKNANGSLRSGKDILMDVSRAFTRLDENQKLFVTQQLVGIEQSARMVKVFDNLGKVTEITGVAMNAAGSAAKEVAARLGSGAVQLGRFKAGLENLGIEMGDKFRDAASKAVGGATEILAAMNSLTTGGALDPLFSALSSFGARLYDYFAIIAKNLPEAFAGLHFDGLLDALGGLGRAFGAWFESLDLTTVDGLRSGLQGLVDAITGLTNVTAGMVEAFKPYVQTLAEMLIAMARTDDETQNTMGTVLGLAMAVEKLGLGFMAALTAVNEYKLSLTGMFNIAAGGAQVLWNGFQLMALAVQDAFVLLEKSVLNALKVMSLGLVTLLPSFRDLEAVVNESAKKISAGIERDGADARKGLDRMIDGFNQLATESGKAAARVPTKIETQAEVNTEAWREGINQAIRDLNVVPAKKKVAVTARMDTASVVQVERLVRETLPDGTVSIHQVLVDSPGVERAKKALDAIPGKKTTEVSLETARLKEQADTVQKSIEWKAKLDIENVQANAKIAEAAIGSIGTGIKSTGDLMASMFEALSKNPERYRFIKDQIEAEERRRQTAMEQQKDLVAKQIEMMQLRIQSQKEGNNTIEIRADGLKPHLEAFMWEILAAIQVRVNQDAGAFLLGVS